MAVTIDSNSGVKADASGVTTLTLTTFTVGAGSNRALLVSLSWSVNNPGVFSSFPRWDELGVSQPMTLIPNAAANASDNTRTELYGLVNPTSGNKTLKASWLTSAELIIFIVSFNGVDQSGGAVSFPNGTSSTGGTANPSITVSSTQDDYTIATENSGTGVASGQTQTLVATQSGIGSDNPTTTIGIGSSGGVTHGYTLGASPWALVGANIKAFYPPTGLAANFTSTRIKRVPLQQRM